MFTVFKALSLFFLSHSLSYFFLPLSICQETYIPSASLLIANEKTKYNRGERLNLYPINVGKIKHSNNDSLSLKFFKIKSKYISILLCVKRNVTFTIYDSLNRIFLLVIPIYTLTLCCLSAVVHLVKKTLNTGLPTVLCWCWECLGDSEADSFNEEICIAVGWQAELCICLFHLSDSQWD